MNTETERTVPMEITIKIGKDLVSERKFLLYPGTEVAYGQAVDLAVSTALAKVSKVAYDHLSGVENLPENLAAEVWLGKALQE